MALITIQRSPSVDLDVQETENSSPDVSDEDEEDELKNEEQTEVPYRQYRRTSSVRQLRKLLHSVHFLTKVKQRSSESYCMVKGAALALDPTECARSISESDPDSESFQSHLQSMFSLLRPHDTIKIAVKLECLLSSRHRYLVLVSCQESAEREECVILGVDCDNEPTIGLVLPIYADTQIDLEGDGGIFVLTHGHRHQFKPISVQTMWSVLHILHKVQSIAVQNKYFRNGHSLAWVNYYKSQIRSDHSYIVEWFSTSETGGQCSDAITIGPDSPSEDLHICLSSKLREIMMSVNLEDVTSKELRAMLEKAAEKDLSSYKSYIDKQILFIYGQMDSASLILPNVYLGSEWNASNLEELRKNQVKSILNVTREIDNFYPGVFEYMNVREYDTEETDLLKYWDKTSAFISHARSTGSNILVHCKMGVSRSAATTIAYVMKETGKSVNEALEYVKTKRPCIKPLPNFIKQLEIYSGMLKASGQRYTFFMKSRSSSDLMQALNVANTVKKDIDSTKEGNCAVKRSPSWSQRNLSANKKSHKQGSHDNQLSNQLNHNGDNTCATNQGDDPDASNSSNVNHKFEDDQ